LGDGNVALLAFSGARVPEKAELPQERAGRARQLAERTAENEVASYIAELRRAADVTQNPKVFE
jgi:hypothetical protein